jgi:hypothetical protein
MRIERFLLPVMALALLVVLHGPCPAAERFTDNGDGTVTDHKLRLMWAKTDNQGDIDWKGAVRWARFSFPLTLPEEMREGWRLPTLEEIQSLYVSDESYEGYETDCGQHVYMTPQIELSCGWVWASQRRSITARVFNFQRGYHYTDRIVHRRAYRALPVRDLEP